MFNKLFSKSSLSHQAEFKSAYSVGQYYNMFKGCGEYKNSEYLNYNIQDFLNDYLLSPALNRVVNLIVNKAVSIEKVLKDNKNDEFIYKHDFLDLINNPNPFESNNIFFKNYFANYLLTGNAFINVVSRLGDSRANKEPLELQTLSPVDVNPQSNSRSRYTGSYQYNASTDSIRYEYDPATQKYLSKEFNEIIHLRDYNPNYNTNCLFGSSRVQAIRLEIEQYLQSSIHNYSILKNQGRPSAIVSMDDDTGMQLSLEQKTELEERLKGLKGSSNAGRINFMPFKINWQPMSESIKDMDFKNLKVMTEQSIYKAFNVPLSFATEESSTMNNKNIARLDLYDDAVLPLVKLTNQFLTEKILKTRYKDGADLTLTYDEFTIEPLRERKLQDAERKNKLNKFSANEIRRDLGEEAFIGGDTIYQPMNLVPIGQDQFTADNRETPSKSQSLQDANNFEKEYYIKQMLKKGYKLEDIERNLNDNN